MTLQTGLRGLPSSVDDMFGWLRKIFCPGEVKEFRLRFEFDVNDDGSLVARVLRQRGKKFEPVMDVSSFWEYGDIKRDNGQRLLISPKSFEAILALRRLSPRPQQDGSILVDIYPHVLQYLRKTGCLSETKRAKQIAVSNDIVRPACEIDLELKTGLLVRTGYSVPGREGLVALEELDLTQDKKFALVENIYIAVQTEVSPQVQEWLSQTERNISLDHVPSFFKKDLPMLLKQMNAKLSNSASKIVIIDDPLPPFVRVTAVTDEWIDFDLAYGTGQLKISHDIASHMKSTHLHPDSYTWIEVNSKMVQQVDKQLSKLEVNSTPHGYSIHVEAYKDLENFMETIDAHKEVCPAYEELLERPPF